MKKVLRCLAVVAMVTVCMVFGNRQEVTMENDSAKYRLHYELMEDEAAYESKMETRSHGYPILEYLDDEEKELIYMLTRAEATPNSMNYVTVDTLKQRLPQDNYYPSNGERWLAYLMAYAQTRDEEPIIQTMGTNVAINIAKSEGMNLIDVFTYTNLFSGMHDGVPSISITNEDGKLEWIPVTEDMLTDELKEAVDLAFEQDFTEGSLHYYNIYNNYSKLSMPEEFIQEGDWIFFKEFSK